MNTAQRSPLKEHRSRTLRFWLVAAVATAFFSLSLAGKAQTWSPTPPIPTPTPGNPFNYGANNGCDGTPLQDVDPDNPNPGPPLEYLPQAWQPGDGSKLSWQLYIPDPATFGPGPYPTVIMIHGDGYHYGNSFEPPIISIATDLKNSGYFVLAVNFRLSRCGRIQGQDPDYNDPASGRPPQQNR